MEWSVENGSILPPPLHTASVLACSPEGALRYWADPQQRGSDQPLEGSVDVGEGTAFSVVSVSDGFVLATSLATLYHITAPSEKVGQVNSTHIHCAYNYNNNYYNKFIFFWL